MASSGNVGEAELPLSELPPKLLPEISQAKETKA